MKSLDRPPSPRRVALVFAASLLVACTTEQADEAKDKTRELAEQAGEKGRELGEKAGEKGRELGEQAGEKGLELADKARTEVERIWGEQTDDGQLSASAKAILQKGAAASGDGAEALLEKGEQLAPVAMDVAKTLDSVIDSERMIEPIIQDLEDEDAQAELDARIADMPRVETIDGVDVGFKELTQYDSGGRETESAYLILWRKDDRLLGLIYRSTQRVNVDKLVAEAPRLIALVQGAM